MHFKIFPPFLVQFSKSTSECNHTHSMQMHHIFLSYLSYLTRIPHLQHSIKSNPPVLACSKSWLIKSSEHSTDQGPLPPTPTLLPRMYPVQYPYKSISENARDRRVHMAACLLMNYTYKGQVWTRTINTGWHVDSPTWWQNMSLMLLAQPCDSVQERGKARL